MSPGTHSPLLLKPKKPLLIIAEDDVDDQLLLRDALEDNGLREEDILFVDDGKALMERLEQEQTTRPTVILLDLNMPRMDGREALREIKNSQRFRHIPVIIFTTSNSDDDIRLAYQNGSNSYFTKPSLYDDLVDTMALILRYWFEKALFSAEPARG